MRAPGSIPSLPGPSEWQKDIQTVELALHSLNGFLQAVGGPQWYFLDETLHALHRIEHRLREMQ